MISIKSMFGLGDCIYARPFIKKLSGKDEVLLETPWPELYQDLPNVKFVKPITNLRTQKKNSERAPPQIWSRRYRGQTRQMSYTSDGIIKGMTRSLGVSPGVMDLPDFDSPIQGKYAVVRPATVRKEWVAASRNPDPSYIANCASKLLSEGYTVISVADLEDGVEWALEPLPDATIRFHRGELNVTQLMGLIKHASLVVGGIGWMVPAAIAYNVPAWFIFGGFGKYNSPENLFDFDLMDMSKIGYAIPDKFCRCADGKHHCDKEIVNHDEKFAEWLGRLPNLVP